MTDNSYNCNDDIDNLIDDLIYIIGREATEKLFNEFKGVRIFIPSTPKPSHYLIPVIGFDNFVKLCDYFGGERITLPMKFNSCLVRRRMILSLHQKGRKIMEIARQVDISEGQVFRILREKDKICLSKAQDKVKKILPLFDADTD